MISPFVMCPPESETDQARIFVKPCVGPRQSRVFASRDLALAYIDRKIADPEVVEIYVATPWEDRFLTGQERFRCERCIITIKGATITQVFKHDDPTLPYTGYPRFSESRPSHTFRNPHICADKVA